MRNNYQRMEPGLVPDPDRGALGFPSLSCLYEDMCDNACDTMTVQNTVELTLI